MHAARRHAGESRLLTALLMVALLGLHPGDASAGTGVSAGSHALIAVGGLPSTIVAGVAADGGGGGDAAVALSREGASNDVRYVATWIATDGDNEALPYIIIDKVDAKVYVFDATGRLQGTAAALLGMVAGDGSSDGVGNRALSAIGPSQRTTPAGRFMASVGPDLHGQDILWVDYDTALALHRVAKGTPAERRAQRLESPTPGDNRISYGCINVPVAFYEQVVGPAFRQSGGVVYILPEMRSAREMFNPGAARLALDAGHEVP